MFFIYHNVDTRNLVLFVEMNAQSFLCILTAQSPQPYDLSMISDMPGITKDLQDLGSICSG
jgi:hypothetical protein